MEMELHEFFIVKYLFAVSIWEKAKGAHVFAELDCISALL